MDISELESEALALPAKERAALANRLLESLDDVDETEFDRLWVEESRRRANRADSNGEAAISDSAVSEKARALLR